MGMLVEPLADNAVVVLYPPVLGGWRMKWFVVGTALALAGCQNGGVGLAESPAWFMTASQEQQMAYFGKRCAGYGVKPGTPEMTQCLMDESRSARGNARRRMASASDDMIRASQRPSRSPVTTNCSSFGNSVSCTTY